MDQQKQRCDPEIGVNGIAAEVGPRDWSGTASAEIGIREWSEWNSSSGGGTQRVEWNSGRAGGIQRVEWTSNRGGTHRVERNSRSSDIGHREWS